MTDPRDELIKVYEIALEKVLKESFLESEGAYAEAQTALAQGAEIKKRIGNEK